MLVMLVIATSASAIPFFSKTDTPIKMQPSKTTEAGKYFFTALLQRNPLQSMSNIYCNIDRLQCNFITALQPPEQVSTPDGKANAYIIQHVVFKMYVPPVRKEF